MPLFLTSTALKLALLPEYKCNYQLVGRDEDEAGGTVWLSKSDEVCDCCPYRYYGLLKD